MVTRKETDLVLNNSTIEDLEALKRAIVGRLSTYTTEEFEIVSCKQHIKEIDGAIAKKTKEQYNGPR